MYTRCARCARCPLLCVQVCRSAGYYEHALYVALAAGEPHTYLDILLEDCARWGSSLLCGCLACERYHALMPWYRATGLPPADRPLLPSPICHCHRFGEGLEFIKGLSRREAAAALQKYGKVGLPVGWHGVAGAGRAVMGRCPAGAPLLPPVCCCCRCVRWCLLRMNTATHVSAAVYLCLCPDHRPFHEQQRQQRTPATSVPRLRAAHPSLPPCPTPHPQALLVHVPVEATALLMELCLRDPADPAAYAANMADFTHLYADRWVGVGCVGVGWGRLEAVEGGGWGESRSCVTPAPAAHLLHRLCSPVRPLPPVPHLYRRPEDLQYACVTILNMNPDSPSRQTLYHTLLDLYLSPATPSSVAAAAAADAPGSSSSAAAADNAAAGAGGDAQPPAGAGAGAAQQAATGRAAAAAEAAAAAGRSGGSTSSEALDLLK